MKKKNDNKNNINDFYEFFENNTSKFKNMGKWSN